MLACKREPHYCADILPECIVSGFMTGIAFINAVLNKYLKVTPQVLTGLRLPMLLAPAMTIGITR